MTRKNSKSRKATSKPARRATTRTEAGTKFDKRRVEDRDLNFDPRSKENDAAWYAQNGQLMSDVASFSYNYPVGGQMPKDTNASKYWKNTSVPGIMTIHTTPRFGSVTQANDPINVSMRNLYSFVRHANSGSTNYEAPDYMLYLTLMDSCFSFIECLKRAYGTLMTYSYTNRYAPVALVHAQGFNFKDLQENIADFRAYINTLAVKVGSMCIPASLAYMARHQWMYSGMYYDTPENSKAQIYMYVPEAFYRFNYDADGAGAATLIDFDRTKYSSDYIYPTRPGITLRGWTFKDIVQFGNDLIDPILADEDMNIMSGDTLKAFGSANIYMISTIPDNYAVVPTYSQEVLNQIHNTSLCGRSIQPSYKGISAGTLPVATKNNSLVQSADKTYLLNTPHATFILPYQVMSDDNPEDIWYWDDYNYWDPDQQELYLKLWEQSSATKRVLDFESGPVSPEQAMVASRLTTTIDMDSAACVQYETADGDTGAERHGMNTETNYYWIHGNLASTGSDSAGFAKIWYFAHVGMNTQNDWCLIHTEDIYTGMWNVEERIHAVTIDETNFMSDLTFSKTVFSAQRRAMLSTFNMHPAIYEAWLVSVTTTDNSENLVSDGINWPQFDINYYTILDEADLKQMHEVALLSELNVTQYGRRA